MAQHCFRIETAIYQNRSTPKTKSNTITGMTPEILRHGARRLPPYMCALVMFGPVALAIFQNTYCETGLGGVSKLIPPSPFGSSIVDITNMSAADFTSLGHCHTIYYETHCMVGSGSRLGSTRTRNCARCKCLQFERLPKYKPETVQFAKLFLPNSNYR